MDFESGYSARMAWDWSWRDWTCGWCSAFAEFGIGALVIGPLHVTLTWPAEEAKLFRGAE